MSISIRKRNILGLVAGGLLLVFSLAACGSQPPLEANEAVNANANAANGAVMEPDTEAAEGGLVGGNASEDTVSLTIPGNTLVDGQGAVEVAVTPLAEASTESGRLIFEVSMNTHSVDLSMNLAELAELVTDTGLTLPATSWSGGSGHHVTGHLEFALPQGAASDKFAEAKNWVLTIRSVDANQRVFIWDLG